MRQTEKTHIPEGYKKTDLGIIPDDWQLSSLFELAVFGGGTTPSRSNYDRYYENGCHSWVKTLDLNNSKIFETDEKVTELALHETSLKKYKIGTVLIAMYGGFNQIGRTGLLKVDAAVNQALVAITPKTLALNSEFLLQNLNFNIEYWKTVASSSRKDPNITSDDVKKYPIITPSFQEQAAIANALSDVDVLIEKQEKLILKKKAIKTATMQKLLMGKTRLPEFAQYLDGSSKGYKSSELGEIPSDWEVRTYDELFLFLSTSTNSRSELNEYGCCGYIHYGDIHMKFDTVLDLEKKSIPYINKNKVSSARIHEGDLVMADASEDYEGIGKSIEVVNVFERELIAGLHTFLLRQKKHFFSLGFKGYLHQITEVKKQLERLATGLKVYGLSKMNLATVSVPLPSLEEQTAIATVLNDMDHEIEQLQRRLSKTRQIKQGMMQELLTGRTRLPLTPESVNEISEAEA